MQAVVTKLTSKFTKGRKHNSLVKQSARKLSTQPTTTPAKSTGAVKIPEEFAIAYKAESEKLISLSNAIKDARRDYARAKENVVLEQAAKALGKSVKDLSKVEIAKHLLDKREDFVKNIDLEKVVLFSSQARLEEFKKFKASIDVSKLPKGSPLPEILEAEQKSLEKLAANEEVIEVEVDDKLYSWVKNRLFPTFKEKGHEVTEQEFADYYAFDSSETADQLAQFGKLYTQAGEKFQLPLTSNYMIDRDADLKIPLSPEARQLGEKLREIKIKQAQAAKAIGKKIHRHLRPGDIYPEKRLIAGETDQSHPLLDEVRKIYVPGTLKLTNQGNLGDLSKLEADDDAFKAIIEQRSEEFSFEVDKEFHAPTQFREPSEDDLKNIPQLKNRFLRSLLDFVKWEGTEARQPMNAGERMLGLKLWKFWAYIYPQYATSAQRQRFAEEFEISPGERTLEWTLAYPPEEHTFTEVPIIKETEGDEDEHHAAVVPHKSAIQWPRYRPQLQNVIWDADVEYKEDHGHDTLKVKTKGIATKDLGNPEYRAAVLTAIKDQSKNPEILSKVDKYLADLKSSRKVAGK